uniref:Cystathionine gamma-synthase n=1 Tax=Oryza punctata TaxID=4537 RepID=A0A0E0L9V6_ORYPU
MVAQEPQRNSPTPRHTWLFSRPLMELPTSLVPRVVLGRRSILRRCRTSKTTATHDDVDRHDDAPTEQRRRRDTSDDTLVVHAGERRCAALVIGGGGGVVAAETTDSIATPIVTGTVHWFRDSADLVAFREGRCLRRRHSFEYGRYGNPTVKVLEDKISAMERAEATIVTSSGMNAIIATLLAVVSPGGHVVATTDCYSEARAFIRDRLPKMGIRKINGIDVQSTFVDLDDMEALKSVLDHQGNVRDRSEPQTVHKMLELRVFLISNENMRMQVTMFYADSPTNPHLKCVDVRRVAELCHQRGALVCIDSTMASPINQKPLTLGADVVLHSVTKYIAGHHDVIAGCISGSEAIISRIRVWHHDLGGTISPRKGDWCRLENPMDTRFPNRHLVGSTFEFSSKYDTAPVTDEAISIGLKVKPITDEVISIGLYVKPVMDEAISIGCKVKPIMDHHISIWLKVKPIADDHILIRL